MKAVAVQKWPIPSTKSFVFMSRAIATMRLSIQEVRDGQFNLRQTCRYFSWSLVRRTTSGRSALGGSVQTSSGNISTASVTPSTSNGLVIAMLTVDTITGISPGLFDAGTTRPAIGISPVDQDGGLALNYNTDMSPELFVWTASGGAPSRSKPPRRYC
jgi:hypothetical protein